MKRIISAWLAFAMLVTMLTGVQIAAYASQITGIRITLANGAVELCENCGGYMENDGASDYFVYALDGRELMQEGSEVEISYYDEPTETYTCERVYRNDKDYDLVYRCGDKNLELFDAEIETDQSPTNRWEVGSTYTATLVCDGQRADFDVFIAENPVESVFVGYDRQITLAEHCEGEWAHEEDEDDWFFYYANYQYLNDAGVWLTVTYKDGTENTYSFWDNNWLPTDENGAPLEERFFDFSFNQMRHERHFHAGDEGRTARVTYYGMGIDDLPVQIVSGTMDSGTIAEGQHRKILFIGDEMHTVTFTPEEDGVYVFEESLADALQWEQYRISGALLDENGDVVESLSNDMLFYILEGGKTYTLTAQKVEENGPCFEFLSVKNALTPISVAFTPAEPIYVYDGDRFTDEIIFRMGNRLDVTFSNGDTVQFTCDNHGNFIDGTEEGGVRIEDYRDRHGLDFDCGVYVEPYSPCWEYGNPESFVDIYVGPVHTVFEVTVLESPYESIAFEPAEPLVVYEGTSRTERDFISNDEWEIYQRYDLNRWDLEREGNRLTVTDLDGNETVYECRRVDDGWGNDYLAFTNDDGEQINMQDFIVHTEQSYDNEWQLGETYALELYYKGQFCEIPVTVAETPVESVNVSVASPIEVFEERNGHFEHDNENDVDYFRYDDAYDYLRGKGAVMTVEMKNGDTLTYDYHTYHWLPCDENDVPVEEKYFDFRFDQDETPLQSGTDNAAFVTFYGVRSNDIPVTVTPTHDVNEGALPLDERQTLLFLDGEEHGFTFTPATDGYYSIEEGMRDFINFEDGTLLVKQGNTVIEKENNNDDLIYRLKGGKQYQFIFGKEHDGIRVEYLRLTQQVSVTDFRYTYVDGTITVSEGDYGNGGEIFTDGSTLQVWLSNGESEAFTYCDNDDFKAGDGRRLSDFLRDNDVFGDYELRVSPNMTPWELDEVSYYTLTLCGVSKNKPVTVSASSVESITYHSVKTPTELVPGADFAFEDWDERTHIYRAPFFNGDTVDVTYADERGTLTYKHDWDNHFYRDTDEGREYIDLNYTFDDTQNYDVGDTMEFEVIYQTGRASLTAAVIENDVESIEFSAAIPYTVYFESSGWWEDRDYYNPDTGNNEHETFFHYDTYDAYKTGNVITVHYTDGTTAAYEYNGRFYMDEDGRRLDDRYIYTEDEQWNNHWYEGSDNCYYVVYKERRAPIPVTVVDPGEWELYARAHDSRGMTYGDGDTLCIEKGQSVFVYFESDFRNRDHDVADLVGFSDGYDEGTLTARGFDVRTGNDDWFGYNFGNQFGLCINPRNLRVGTEATLYFYLYEGADHDYNNFDFVNTPHAADYALTVRVVDHQFDAGSVVPATCTAKGYTEYTCALCGVTYRGDFSDFAPHEYAQTVTDATPNTKGYTTYSCANCDYEYIGDITGYASDDSALSAAVVQCGCLEAADYSSATFGALQAAIDAADGLEQGENPQVELDNATAEILTAVTDLQPYLLFGVDAEHGTVQSSVPNGTYLQGQPISLTATPDDGYTFGGWYETGSKRVFSKDGAYSFVLTSNTQLVALFTPTGESGLTFANKSGQIVATVSKTPAAWGEVSDLAALAPAVPYSYGCTNGAWQIPDGTLAALQNGENAVVMPVYDESAAFVPEAYAQGSTPGVNLYYTYDSGANVGSFVMAVDIPDGTAVESVGTAFYYKKAADFDPTQFMLTVNNKTATSKFDENQSGVYVTNMNKMSGYYNWAVRGYVTYYDKDGKLKTSYSQQINIVNRQQV